jgi:tRNA-(ms[2]io[6]A)-hydroxylase
MSKPPGGATNVTVAAFFHGFEDIRPQWNTPFELCLLTIVTLEIVPVDDLPLHSQTPTGWAATVLADPVNLLIDHAFLEKKAANNAMELMTRWPGDPDRPVSGWVETMTSVARDETSHLAQVVRLLARRNGRLDRTHKNPYANELRLLVRKGTQPGEILDRLFVSALIEARSCERFRLLAEAAAFGDPELAKFYGALYASELGHFKVFLKLANKIAPAAVVEARWCQMLELEAEILSRQEPGPRIHSGCVQ